MNYTTRILGYDITLSKPNSCVACNKKQVPDILERIIDTQDGELRYIMVLKCNNCHKISFAVYKIGPEKELKNISEHSKLSPIEPQSVLVEG